jgi:hypothetical protein
LDRALVVAENVLISRWSKESQKPYRQLCIEGENKVKLEAFQRFLADLLVQHEEPLMTTIRPHAPSCTVYVAVSDEKRRPATRQLEVFKIKSDGGALRTEFLGAHRLNPDTKDLKAFTVKNRCMVLITTHPRETLVERVYFPPERSPWKGKVTCVRTFRGKASLCDFDVLARVVAFGEEDGRVELYRFDEMFTSLEIFTCIELSRRTSLAFPVTNVLLTDGALYATDSNGSIQSVNLTNPQTSRAVHIMCRELQQANILVAMADSVVLGFIASPDNRNASGSESAVKFAAVAREDFREIPVVLADGVAPWSSCECIQCFGDTLFVLDSGAKRVRVLHVTVTVRSDSFRTKRSVNCDTSGFETDDVEHWLLAFYHTYERFPARGLIRGVDARFAYT